MIRWFFSSIWIVFTLPMSGEVSYSGFSKLNYAFNSAQHPVSKHYRQLLQINRLTLTQNLTEKLFWESSYELTLAKLTQEQNLIYNRSYRIEDMGKVIFRDRTEHFYGLQNLDRFSVTYNEENYSVVLGRQQISFGSGRTFNPTDIFSPLIYNTIDSEIRNGVDGIRLRKQMADIGQLDIGVVLGESAQYSESGIYFLSHFVKEKWELKQIFSVFKNAHLIGLDFTTTLLGAGLWWESAWVAPNNEDSYIRSVIGGETQVSSALAIFLEYDYNGAGVSDSSDYATLANKFAYQKGGVFLFGKNYLDVGANVQISPLHSANTFVQSNLEDKSTFTSTTWEWNFLENFYFNAGAFLALGSANSEFKSTPNTFFSRLRFYF